jgi:hypothetical protein
VGRISLSKALIEVHERWAGLTVGNQPVESWADMDDDGQELEPIRFTEDDVHGRLDPARR